MSPRAVSEIRVGVGDVDRDSAGGPVNPLYGSDFFLGELAIALDDELIAGLE